MDLKSKLSTEELPHKLIREQLNRTGYSMEDYTKSVDTIKWFLWYDFFQEEPFKHDIKTMIEKMQHHENYIKHIISTPQPEHVIATIHLAEVLVRLSKIKNISPQLSTYISRLGAAADKWVQAAIFELHMADFYSQFGEVELQKANGAGNPVEISLNKGWINFRFECTSTHDDGKMGTIHDKILQKLSKFIDGNDGFCLLVDINDVLDSNLFKQINDFLFESHKAGRKCSKIFDRWKCEYQGIQWDWKKLKQYVNHNYSCWRIGSTQKEDDIKYIDWDLKHLGKECKYNKIIWVNIPHEEIQKNIEKITNTFFEKIKEKIKQQQSVIDSWDELVILIDRISYPQDIDHMNFQKKLIDRFESQDNTSIFIVTKEENMNTYEIIYEFGEVIVSPTYRKLFLTKPR